MWNRTCNDWCIVAGMILVGKSRVDACAARTLRKNSSCWDRLISRGGALLGEYRCLRFNMSLRIDRVTSPDSRIWRVIDHVIRSK